jgi:hypothetical protein
MAEERVFTNSLDAAVLKKFGGATCSHCHKTAIVRDSDMLCFMCWSNLGEPESPNVIRPKPTFDTSMRKQ